MLLAGGGLDGGDDLAGDAQLGEGPERRLPLGPVVADGLEQADHPLLLEVVEVAAGDEVAAGLGPGEAPVALEQEVERLLLTEVAAVDERVVGDRRRVGRGRLVVRRKGKLLPAGATPTAIGCCCVTIVLRGGEHFNGRGRRFSRLSRPAAGPPRRGRGCPAAATLSEGRAPAMGIDATTSHRWRTRRDRPSPSEPTHQHAAARSARSRSNRLVSPSSARPDHPAAQLLGPGQGRRQAGHQRDGDVLDGAGRRLGHRRGDVGRPAAGEHGAGGARPVGAAQEGADVAGGR